MTMEIQSYHRAFAADRRIYRIDRWTVPVPGGLPLAATTWFLVFAIVAWSACQLPGLDRLSAAVGWPATVLVGPGAAAIAVTRRMDDGRSLPRAKFDQLAMLVRDVHPMPVKAARALADHIAVVGDLSIEGTAIVRGPGRIVLPPETVIRHEGGGVVLAKGHTPTRATDLVIDLGADDRLEVRS